MAPSLRVGLDFPDVVRDVTASQALEYASENGFDFALFPLVQPNSSGDPTSESFHPFVDRPLGIRLRDVCGSSYLENIHDLYAKINVDGFLTEPYPCAEQVCYQFN